MTDTSRSLEDVKDLLADNSSGDISAQDMRDLVESIAHPLPGEGFQGPTSPALSVSYVNAAAQVTLVADPTSYGDVIAAPFGANRPGGAEFRGGRDLLSASYSLAGSDPASAYGVDVDAGNAFMLEPGLWVCHGAIQSKFAHWFDWPGTAFPPINAYVDQVTFEVGWAGASDGSEPWAYPGFFNPMIVTQAVPLVSAAAKYSTVHIETVVVNDTDDPQPFALYLYTNPGQTTDVDTTFYGVTFRKVS